MNWFRKAPAAVPEPKATTTLIDQMAEAHAAWKLAEVKLADACTALNRFRVTHPAHIPVKRIGNDVWLQFTPNDPELLKLSSAENRARADRDAKQKLWADRYRELHPEEIHIAGVRV
jgi:hypothetical protein